MKRLWAAALVALASIVSAAPAGAQECADFGSRKAAQQQLEQVGDPAGALDPDGDGYACEDELVVFQAAQQVAPTAETAPAEGEVAAEGEGPTEGDADGTADDGAAEPAPLDAAVTIQADGPAVGDDASGTSGGTVSAAPGVESAMQAEGEGNSEENASDVGITDEGVSAGDATAVEESASAGDAAATNDETGETATAGEAEAVDTDDAETEKPKPVADQPKPVVEEPKPVAEEPKTVVEAPAPAPVVAPAPVEAAPAEAAPAAAAAPVVPVQLPNTGVGFAGAAGLGGWLASLLVLAAVGALIAARRFARE
jgi:outer membrane biosynthesis protein TonB